MTDDERKALLWLHDALRNLYRLATVGLSNTAQSLLRRWTVLGLIQTCIEYLDDRLAE